MEQETVYTGTTQKTWHLLKHRTLPSLRTNLLPKVTQFPTSQEARLDHGKYELTERKAQLVVLYSFYVKYSVYTSSTALSIALAFLFLPTMALGRPDPTPFTSSRSGEQGLEPAPFPLLVFFASSFLGSCNFVRSSLSSSTHSSNLLLTSKLKA